MRDWMKWKRGARTSAIVGVGFGVEIAIGFLLAGVIISLLGLMSVEIPSQHWWDIAAPFALVFGPLFVGQLVDEQKIGCLAARRKRAMTAASP